MNLLSGKVVMVTGSTRRNRILWAGMLSLCAIAAAAVIHRMVALAFPLPNLPAPVAALDAAFAEKPILTLAHIIPALVFVLLVPFQFSTRLRARHASVHRLVGRILMVLAAVISLSALLLALHPIGGITEVTAILFYDGLFMLAMAKAFIYARRRQIALHREWVIRGISVALGVATVRPIMGVFFASSRLTGLTPHEFFGVAFWMGFTLTYVFAEVWLRRTRPAIANWRPAGNQQVAKDDTMAMIPRK
ncbi:MAG: DUF2306 domain-containing protein [Terriglobia bacterium]